MPMLNFRQLQPDPARMSPDRRGVTALIARRLPTRAEMTLDHATPRCWVSRARPTNSPSARPATGNIFPGDRGGLGDELRCLSTVLLLLD
jgi:hypothetical protein